MSETVGPLVTHAGLVCLCISSMQNSPFLLCASTNSQHLVTAFVHRLVRVLLQWNTMYRPTILTTSFINKHRQIWYIQLFITVDSVKTPMSHGNKLRNWFLLLQTSTSTRRWEEIAQSPSDHMEETAWTPSDHMERSHPRITWKRPPGHPRITWKRPPGHPRITWKRLPGHPWITWMKTVLNDLESHNLTLTEAVNMAQNHLLWRLI